MAKETDESENVSAFCEVLLRSFAAGVTELHVWTPSFVTDVSERPLASAVARHQSRRGKRISTLRHTGLELNDALSRKLLDLLDGTRDFAALAEALSVFVQSSEATLESEGERVSEPAQIRKIIAAELPQTLSRLARAAILLR